MRLSQRLVEFWQAHPIGIVLDADQVRALAVKAMRLYHGYSRLELCRIIGEEIELEDLDPDFCLTESEWAIIRPLFELYVERENARFLESSRGQGLDVYGRGTSEIQGDITQYEMELPHKAFFEEATTV